MLIVTILCGCAIVCYGRVFLRWGSSVRSAGAIEASGGRIAYETAVIVNGGKGHLTVYSFDKPVTRVVRELRRIFNTDRISYSGGSTTTTLIHSNDRVIRLIMVPLEDYLQTIVFHLEQSARDFNLSSVSPSRHLMKNIPAFPGSKPVFFAKDEATHMSMALSNALSTPEGVYNFFESSLTASGWTPAPSRVEEPARSWLPTMTPVRDGSNRHAGHAPRMGGLSFYLRGNEICCLFVHASDIPGESRTLLLYKEQRGGR